MDDPIPALKRHVAAAIVGETNRFSANEAAYWMGADQPRVSDLRHGKLERFSLERLIRFATRLKGRVGLTIEFPERPKAARAQPRRAP
jgi:predicted XRE-type DNA-binding protein